jgi:hypothetical protein
MGYVAGRIQYGLVFLLGEDECPDLVVLKWAAGGNDCRNDELIPFDSDMSDEYGKEIVARLVDG